ncbi:hypothetical protein Poli38472_001174 [Pythium oligandrum]|uniref:N-acetyltransferase domain-containing protein n=1 Tax=Pythium oligandrum TaxID=41045 RepID=A0A8K1CU59_PYTOL|nr:hypothetical protein Poli38472_001174 [Pythium oligandrum]|eukprot:TMW69018.1 hypothetical protein Poli38472_001174 [Pythium oligandrum]
MATLSFGPITDKNVEMLRKINLQIFPARYNDTFYGDVLFTPRGYTKFAYWDGYIVGAICCRLESQDERPHAQRAYIMTLGVLAPYRQFQIGSALVRSIIKHAVADNIDDIYLHVQTSNDVALCFYRSFGFEITEIIRDYYKHIDPPDCYVLVKKLSTKATNFP